jgi:hypothetical protein
LRQNGVSDNLKDVKTVDNTPSPAPQKGLSRRQFIMTGAIGTGVLTLGAIAYRVAVLPDSAPAVAGGVLTRQELAAVEALALAHFPPGNAFDLDGREAGVAGYVDRYLAQLAPADQNLIRALIWLYDQGTVLGGKLTPVRLMPPEEAREYVLGWEQSKFGWRRDLGMSLRTVLGMAYFTHPKAKAALGIIEPCGSSGPTLYREGGTA